jgi:hypothetical protein
MTGSDPFPRYSPPLSGPFSREAVVETLLPLREAGHIVAIDADEFVLPWSEGEVRIRDVEGRWRVQNTRLGILSTFGYASSSVELEDLVSRATGGQVATDSQPTRGRLKAETPATNCRTISRLLHSAEIRAVFDPYLDNASLEQLIHIVSYGDATFAPMVRLLGSTAKTATKTGVPARLSATGISEWAKQLGINAEGRYLPREDEHRRFILLSGGRSLILGPSINSIHKNEAVSVEDDLEDRPFFDARWDVATPLA